MPRDRGIRGIREANLGQPGAPARRGKISRAAHRQRPSRSTVFNCSRVSSALIEPPTTFEPRPSTLTGAAFFLGSEKSVSLAVRQA